MTDDEILYLAEAWDMMIDRKRCFSDVELIQFARSIESRTLTKQKARWFQEGVEAEREACAKICDGITGEKGRQYILASFIAQQIRARGE